ncbi:hypothetical protein [Cysteiniphilum halobium]|uniref:hypothetical protein n=1 Tax=Cysteiniphilum halobium TaxID=2219059 RepID=UPI003F834836
MTTGESTSKGGRPPYVLETDDIQLAKELAEEGLSLENIAKALGISDFALRDLRRRDESFSLALKKGRALEYLSCNKSLKSGDLTPAAYIYFSKTKWKNFYPQEDKQAESKVNIQLTDDQALKIREIAKDVSNG